MKPDWFKSRHGVRLSQVVQIVLGLLLVVAATNKAVFIRAAASVAADNLFRSPLILATVVFAELVIGIWFLIVPGFFPRLTRAVGVSFFGVLSCFSGYATLTGQECHCFGTLHLPVPAVFAIDLVAVALLVWLPLADRAHLYPCPGVRWRLWAFGAAALGCALPVSIWARSYVPSQLCDLGIVLRDARLVILEPAEWIDKRFPLERYAKLPSSVMEGEWLVVLHSRDCPHWQAVLPQLVHLANTARSSGWTHLALIDLLPAGPTGTQTSESGVIVRASVSPD